jgi:hypothetical protein
MTSNTEKIQVSRCSPKYAFFIKIIAVDGRTTADRSTNW